MVESKILRSLPNSVDLKSFSNSLKLQFCVLYHKYIDPINGEFCVNLSSDNRLASLQLYNNFYDYAKGTKIEQTLEEYELSRSGINLGYLSKSLSMTNIKNAIEMNTAMLVMTSSPSFASNINQKSTEHERCRTTDAMISKIFSADSELSLDDNMSNSKRQMAKEEIKEQSITEVAIPLPSHGRQPSVMSQVLEMRANSLFRFHNKGRLSRTVQVQRIDEITRAMAEQKAHPQQNIEILAAYEDNRCAAQHMVDVLDCTLKDVLSNLRDSFSRYIHSDSYNRWLQVNGYNVDEM